MSTPNNPFSILNRGQDNYKQPATQEKAQRKFWPGQKPVQQENLSEEDDDEDIFPEEKSNIGGMSITTEKLLQRQKQKQMQENQSVASSQAASSMKRGRVVQRSEIIESNNNNQISQQQNEGQIKEEQQQFKVPQKKEISETQNTDQKNQNQQQNQVQQIQKPIIQEEVQVNRRERLRQQLLEQEEKNIKQSDNLNEEQELEKRKIMIENQKLKEKIQQQSENIQKDIQNEKLKQKIQQQENSSSSNDEEEEDEEDEDSQEENIDNQQEESQVKLLKPVYVSKEQRTNINDHIIEEIALQEEKKKIQERKIFETTNLVQEVISKEQAQKKDENLSDGGEMPNDDDENLNETEEIALWKSRELQRIRKDRKEKIKYDEQRAEIERRRNMTDEQRLEENQKLGCDSINKPVKTKYKLFQKYYHKGVFNIDSDDELFKRDFNLAVGEDLFDKTNPNLPKILQKRRGQLFKKGQSKYTHLTQEDTTNYDPQFKKDENIMKKQFLKQAGLKGSNVLDRNALKKLKL